MKIWLNSGMVKKIIKNMLLIGSALAWFENGKPHPLRFELNGTELRVEQVVSMTEEKSAGNRMLVFRCQSEINGELRPFEIKFEIGTCKWFLWKMVYIPERLFQ